MNKPGKQLELVPAQVDEKPATDVVRHRCRRISADHRGAPDRNACPGRSTRSLVSSIPSPSMFDVPLTVARGYASLSFLHGAAEHIDSLDVPTYIYHLGDFDPSGVNAGEKIEQTLREMAPDSDLIFERIAVERWQIEAWDLPTRPTKTSDIRSKTFGDISVELDAIEPDRLRSLVEAAIEQHLPQHEFEILKAAEESEREDHPAACPRRIKWGLRMTRRHRRPEDEIQRTVCRHFRQRAAPGLVWWHTPNGGKRRPVEAAILKGIGTRAGVADLIFAHRGRPFALELKTDIETWGLLRGTTQWVQR
jgi:hypothetical protein